MGCWNVTCAVSHLPIQRDDPLRLLLLRQGVWHHDHEPSHPWAQWVPMSLPVRGWYDEYGGIKNVARTTITDLQVETIRRVAQPLTDEEKMHSSPLEEFPNTLNSIVAAASLGFLRLEFDEGRICHVSPMYISESMWRYLCRSISHEGVATRRARVAQTVKRAVARLQGSVTWYRERDSRVEEIRRAPAEDQPAAEDLLEAMDLAHNLPPQELMGGYDSLPDVLVRGDLHDDPVWREGFEQFTVPDWEVFEDEVVDVWTFAHTYELDLRRSFHPNVHPTFQFDPTKGSVESHRLLLQRIQERCDDLDRAVKELQGKTRH